MKIYPYFKIIILVSISLIISLVLGEMILKAIGFSFVYYPEKIEFGWPDPKAFNNFVIPDRELLYVSQDYSYKLEKALKSKPAIVFMGDSCTIFGKYPGKFSSLVSKKYPDKEISYSNFGTGGWSSYQGLQQLKRDVSRIKPEIITISYGWNDHWIAFGLEDKEMAKIFESTSFLFDLQKYRIGQLVVKILVIFSQKDTTGSKEIRPYRVSQEDFRENLTGMVTIARSNKIIPVLLTAPTSHVKGKEPVYLAERFLINLSDLVPLHRKYISIVRDVSKSRNTILCDLARDFDKLSKEEVSKYFWKDGIHFTGKGAQKAAEYLYNCFEQNNLLENILK